MIRYSLKLLVIMAVVLPFYLLIRRPWRENTARAWAETAFILFMAGLLALTFEGKYRNPAAMAESAAERLKSGRGINLVPLRTITGFCRHLSADIFLVNILGNIIMFMPWGFGLALLWKKKQRLSSVLLHSLALPVLIETCQLFIDRSVDVDDLILNFTGGCLGAAVYFGLRKLLPGIGRLAR